MFKPETGVTGQLHLKTFASNTSPSPVDSTFDTCLQFIHFCIQMIINSGLDFSNNPQMAFSLFLNPFFKEHLEQFYKNTNLIGLDLYFLRNNKYKT